MLNIEALDKVIAMVVLLLALSLFVQALQGWLKKLFKIKSLQIEHSLVHLYHYVLNKDAVESLNRMTDNSPMLRQVFRRSHPSERDPQVKALYDGVMVEFKKVGRVSASGKLMLDSISQGDLLKFMGRMPVAGIIAKLFPDSPERFKEMRGQVAAFLAAFNQIKTESSEVANTAEFKKIEEVLTPLLTDIDKFLSGASNDSGVILDDIARLREIHLDEVSQLIKDLPGRIDAIKESVQAGPAGDEVKKATLKALDDMKGAINNLSGGIDSVMAGIAHIRELKFSVANWYDTVMQSFEERYARSMRTWTIVISACVVILMNANIINIYRDISTSDTKRAILLQAAERYRRQKGAPTEGTAPGTPATTTTTTAPAQDDAVTPEQFYSEGKKVMDRNIGDLTALGLKGPGWVAAVPDFFRGIGDSPQASAWLALRTLLGWFIMTMLLSAGAPFWQDTLESLFGLKNKLRKQTDTQNVESKSGAGQPKP
jgi:hypothetical protein